MFIFGKLGLFCIRIKGVYNLAVLLSNLLHNANELRATETKITTTDAC